MKTREGRIIQTVQAPHFYNQPQQHPYAFQKYIPTSESYLNRRIGEAAAELDPIMRRPSEIGNGKVISNLVGPSSQQHQQQQPPSFQKIYPQRQNNFNSPREVSETDLYLLGAIEKLVYRVDYMEKRLKRTEQLVYYLMAGNNQKLQADPCPKSFTKIGENCYHFETSEKSDWKTASSKCKSLGSSLAEMDKLSKFQDVVAHVLNNADDRGHDFWIGGLNPGNFIQSLNYSISLINNVIFQVYYGSGAHLHVPSIPMQIYHHSEIKPSPQINNQKKFSISNQTKILP